MSELDLPTSSYKSDAPFNSAIDCLMRISDLIKKIAKVSIEYTLYDNVAGIHLTGGQAQHIKHRLIIELYKQASVLMTKDAKKEIWPKIMAVKLLVRKEYDRVGQTTKTVEVYSDQVNMELDKIELDILDDLQDSNFFMPPKKKAGMAVLRH